MRKKIIGIPVSIILLLVLVGAISAQAGGPPGDGYWFGATHQNVGTETATWTITAYDSASNNTYPELMDPLLPGAAVNVGPNDFPSLPAGFVGSMVTSSDQPLVAQVNITNRQAGSLGIPDGKGAAIYGGVDAAKANASLSFPLAKNNFFNKTTTFYLQNAGSSATTIDVTFTFGGTDYNYTTPSIEPGQMVAVDPGLAGAPSGAPNGIGAMSLSAGEPIAGAMLEHEASAAVGLVLQGSSGFAPAELAQTIYCPTYKEDHFGRQSGLQVQNAHGAAQDIEATFVGTGGTFTRTESNVAPGASVTFIDEGFAQGLYAATVEGSLGDVAGIVNESELPLPAGVRQTSTTYNCQAASSASTTLSYPAYKELWFGRTAALQIQNVGGSDASVTMSFTDNNGNVRTTNAQTIAPGASSVYVCVSGNAALWSGTALASSTLSGVTVTSSQPIIAVANEASWSSTSPCVPNNAPATAFDKSTANAFNLP